MADTHPSPVIAGLTGRCPACGKGPMFKGFLALRSHCDSCGLDNSFADAGDGPAIFVILIGGFIVVFEARIAFRFRHRVAALIVEVKYAPPFWLHAVIWGPLILLVTLLPLRLLKGLLIALQYHHKAAEGRLERGQG